jgi:hypothetical protein
MGLSCVVFRITSCTLAGVIVGGLPSWPAAWLYTDAVYVDLVEGEYVLV